MLSYRLKCKKKNTKSTNLKVIKTKNGRTMILSECATYGSKKSRFIKKQEAKGILTSLGFKTEQDKIPFFGYYLFSVQ